MRVAFIQFAGDYRAAWRRLKAGEPETYFGQRYSLSVVADVAAACGFAAHVCRSTASPFEERLPDGVLSVGLGQHTSDSTLLRALERLGITHVVTQEPHTALIRWALWRRVRVLLLLTNSMLVGSFREKLRARFLAAHLMLPSVDWVGAYAKDSALQLRALGVSAARILPWDYLHTTPPIPFAPKTLRQPPGPYRLIFAGALNRAKGLTDAYGAVARLVAEGWDVTLDIYGGGDAAPFQREVDAMGLADRVVFHGLVANDRIESRFNAADLAVLPSRHAFPEGCSLSVYHAFRSRTPVVLSDHAMNHRNIAPQDATIKARSGDPAHLAECIAQVLATPERYARMSTLSSDVAANLAVPLKWREAVLDWAVGGAAGATRLSAYALNSGRYSWATD